MVKPLSMLIQATLKDLLRKRTPYTEIMKTLPNVSKAVISKYNKKLFGGATPTTLGRKPTVSDKTQQYIANSI